MNKVPRWVFRYVGNKTFDFSSKKKDFLPKNHPIWPEFGIFVHCWLIWCPVGGLVGGCGAGCISQDTYLLYVIICIWKGSLSILVIYYGIKSNELFASSINETSTSTYCALILNVLEYIGIEI